MRRARKVATQGEGVGKDLSAPVGVPAPLDGEGVDAAAAEAPAARADAAPEAVPADPGLQVVDVRAAEPAVAAPGAPARGAGDVDPMAALADALAHVRAEGGDAELVKVQGTTATVRVSGACRGTSARARQLRDVLQLALVTQVPGIDTVELLGAEEPVVVAPRTLRVGPGTVH